jgi:gamma-glutamylcyclotransferase (GGCT)/AIG2-like uncharacterized protein YtfP
MPEQLFCYGTLCVADIMQRVSGALPASTPATLANYACYGLVGLAYPGMVPRKGDQVHGVLYQGLSRAQLARLDAYEGAQYHRLRVWVGVAPGQRRRAWTYVLAPRYYHRLSGASWSLARFCDEQLSIYLQQSHNKLDGLHGRKPTQST